MLSAAVSRLATLAGHVTSGPEGARGVLRVVQVGLGPIGLKMLSYLSERSSLALVGAIDVAPALVGRDVGELSSIHKFEGIKVTTPPSLPGIAADVCIVTALSDLDKLYPLLDACIRSRKHVISTCEELAFPWNSHPETARKLDRLARHYGVSVLGTGINPGFLMDALPVFLSTLNKQVTSVRVERHQDSRIRRIPFQNKIGVGLSLEEWTKRRDAGKIRHVGFAQSVYLIASAFGWKLEKYEEFVEPVVATEKVAHVEAGQCAGVRQTAYGYVDGRAVITLELQAFHGLKSPHDTVTIHGEPEITSTIVGGAHGDVSTCAIVLNCAAALVAAARPGLLTMLDIPLAHFSA
eukprot:m51a1_g10526 putative dihydrodipicolinate reductase (351) ;mRNA; r:229481-231022